MKRQEFIKNNDQFPITNYIVYKGKQYPIKSAYFRLSSKYFQDNKRELKMFPNIELSKDQNSIDLSEESIINFINYVHQEEICINNSNINELQYLSEKFGVDKLLNEIKTFIKKNENDLALQILLKNQNKSDFNSKIYEDIISENFLNYKNDENLFNLNFQTIYRILKGTSVNENIDFYFKCLDKYGIEASALFCDVDFNKCDPKYLDLLITKDFDAFDFNFVNKSVFIALNNRKQAVEQENNILKGINQTLEQENNRIKDRILEVELENSKLKDRNQIVEQENCKLKDRNQAVEQENIKLKDINQKVEQENIKVKCRNQVVEQEYVRLKDRNQAIKQENSKLKSRNQEIEHENSKLKDRNQEIEQENSKLIDINQAAEQTIMQLKKNLAMKNEVKSNKKIVKSDENNNKEILTFPKSSDGDNGIIRYFDEILSNSQNKSIIDIYPQIGYNVSMYDNLQFDNDNENKFKNCAKCNDDLICFDFTICLIEITSYSIESSEYGKNRAHIKNWVVEISNDEENWEAIDQHSNYDDLNGSHIIQTFDIKQSHPARYCRLRSTGEHYCEDDLEIDHIEFFGNILGLTLND